MTTAAFMEHFAAEPLIANKAERIKFASDGCWEYPTGSKFPYAKRRKDGKNEFIHRLSLQIKVGRPLRADEVARHTCDNPPCVNPEHLLVGTKADNSRDMAERGRWRNKTFTGEDNWKSHPLAIVKAARADYATGLSQEAVAQKYSVSRCAVRGWVHGHRSDAGPSIARNYERPPCGTRAGHRFHQRADEPSCDECQEANNAYARATYHRRKQRP